MNHSTVLPTLRNFITALVLAAFVSACGSAKESTSNSASTITSPGGTTFSLLLTRSSNGNSTNTISSSAPGTVIASIRKSDGSRPQSLLVTFTTDLGALNPGAGTAITNSSGEAQIELLSAGITGAGTVTAQATVGSETLSISLNFSVIEASAAGRTLSVALTDTNGASTSNVRADAPGILTATITDDDGAGVKDVIVTFTTMLGTLDPANGTAITNAAGQASAKLGYKDALGADTVTVTATLGAESLATALNYQVSPPSIRIGFTNGSTFTQGLVGIGATPLSAGGTTSLTVDVVDANGAAFVVPVEVGFTSTCVSVGKSSVDATATTVNGLAIATYQAQGCAGTDTITATASYGGSSFSATGTLVVNSDAAGSIAFISATPTLIAIKGTGGAELGETSTVTFQVKGTQGLALANQLVNFSINTTVGGISVSPISGYTNGEGMINTIIRSGTVATSVRVTATVIVGATTLSVQSDQLTVSTGIPDQNSFSISVSTYNPEAFSFDGEKVTVNAHVADHFNNPVPDGTAVYFTTEGGSIEPACLTKTGSCSVQWTSQDPRPVDHRSTIMITAIGNESFEDEDGDGYYSNGDGEPYGDANVNGVLDEPFTDTNGNGKFDEPFADTLVANGTYDFGEAFVDYNRNGRYDGTSSNPLGETAFVDRNGNGIYDGAGITAAGEAYTDANSSGTFNGPGFADLGEAFLDTNENGTRNLGEPYWDFNVNGQYDTRDGQYSGVLCSHPSLCAAQKTVHVRDSILVIMSGSYANIVTQNAASPNLIYDSNVEGVTPNATLNIPGSSASLLVTLTDSAGQILPAGTQVTISADVGELKGNVSFTIPNATFTPTTTLIVINDDDTTTTASGAITIHVETPKGIVTIRSIPLDV